MGTPLSNKYVLDRAKKLIKNLSPLGPGNAVWILNTAINIITQRPEKRHNGEEPDPSNFGININFVTRGQGRKPGKIRRDSELRNFIHQLDRYYTINELHKLLVDTFGANRAPSINILSKYLKEMSIQPLVNTGGGKS